MHFEYPQLAWMVLPAMAGMGLFFLWSWRARKRLITRFIQTRLLDQLTVGLSPARQKLRMLLLTLSVGGLLFVLARPQWGFTWEEAKQRGLDIVVAIDTSRSMLAPDVAPNRLTRAKLAALDLKRLAKTDRMGLVAFAGTAFLQCPLSFDDVAFQQSVEALNTDIIPQGGTALAAAIRTAIEAFEEKSDNHKILVLFTDGEDHDGHALEAAREAAAKGLRIFTIGVGTPNGELLRITDDRGNTQYLRDEQGNVIKSRLNEALLRQIAEAGHGFYMLLAGANTVELLYERGLAPLPKSELSARRIKRYYERYQWFLGVVMLLLVAELFVPDRRRAARAETISLRGGPSQALRRAALFGLLALWPVMGWSVSPRQAMQAFERGDYERAYELFQQLLEERPDDARLQYNAGAAAYKGSNYTAAVEAFNRALLTDDLKLQQQAYYNLGNAFAMQGLEETEPQKKAQAWQQAIQSYQSALALAPDDQDAKDNLELVKKWLEQLPKDKNQQNQSDNQNQDSQKDQQKDQQDQQQQQQQSQQNSQNQNNSQTNRQDHASQPQGDQNQEQHQAEEQQSQSGEEQKQNQQGDQQSQQQQTQQKEQAESEQESQAQQGERKTLYMTPQEAQRLLDALKSKEKPLIFVPRKARNLPPPKKNW